MWPKKFASLAYIKNYQGDSEIIRNFIPKLL